jgi:hypothetical protein
MGLEALKSGLVGIASLALEPEGLVALQSMSLQLPKNKVSGPRLLAGWVQVF